MELINTEGIEPVEVKEPDEVLSNPKLIGLEDYCKKTSNPLDWIDVCKVPKYGVWSPTEDKGLLALEREVGGGKNGEM